MKIVRKRRTFTTTIIEYSLSGNGKRRICKSGDGESEGWGSNTEIVARGLVADDFNMSLKTFTPN